MTTKTPSVHSLDSVKARLRYLRACGMTWRAIGGEFYPVPGGTLCAIYKHDRYPRKPEYCRVLGLPVIRRVTVNPPRRWRDLPVGELRRAMLNRVEMK